MINTDDDLWYQFGYERPNTVDRWINGEIDETQLERIFNLWKIGVAKRRMKIAKGGKASTQGRPTLDQDSGNTKRTGTKKN